MGCLHIQEFPWHATKLKDKFKHVVSYVMNLHRSVFELNVKRHFALRNPKTLQNMKYYDLGKLQIAQTTVHSIIMMLLNSSSAYLFACAFCINWIPGCHASHE